MSHQDFSCCHLKPLNWEMNGAIPVRPVVSVEASSCSYCSKSREESEPAAGLTNAGTRGSAFSW